MDLKEILPIPSGMTFRDWAKKWLKSVRDDLTDEISEAGEGYAHQAADRNERYGSYLVFLSTISAIYRQEGRRQRDHYYRENSKPDKGIKEWEERRDSYTAECRYMEEWLNNLRDDIQRRISIAQTNINMTRREGT